MAVKLERIVKKYYDFLEEGKIMGRVCPQCKAVEWPPVYACNACGNMETEWQEIDGEAEITISGNKNIVKKGEMIIMPANEPHALQAVNMPYKMILTMIKSD